MKFSIIVPVYNTKDYIKKCLDSIFNQTYSNYEVIIVNDGSPDNSESIIKKYIKDKKKFKLYNKENGGLSDARNFGVLKSKGDYILFLDSDDYIDESLLEELNNNLDDVDVLRFQAIRVEEKTMNEYLITPSFEKTSGSDAFLKLYESKSIEPAPLYAYKREYWIKNKFLFSQNKYHEDFGLIPLVILKAKSLKSIDFKGYYYLNREGSITTTSDYTKNKKKAFDMLEHFDFLIKEVKKVKLDSDVKSIFNSFVANALIQKIETLNDYDKHKYLKELRQRKVIKLVLGNTLKRKLKKIYLIIKYSL